MEKGLLSLVTATAARVECLCGDLRGVGAGAAEDERLINSVVQFDVVAFLVVSAWAPGPDVPYYPSFSVYYWRRFEPALVKLIQDKAMRQEVFPRPDQQLAQEVASMLQLAAREGRGFGVGADLSSAELETFLRDQGASEA